MRRIKMIALLLSLFFSFSSYAVSTPVPVKPAVAVRTIKPTDLERIVGKKLSFFQKLKLKLAQKVIQKKFEGTLTEKQEKWANLSMILGISSIMLLGLSSVAFLGILGLLCFPAAILALVFGIKSLKGNSNTKGIVGVVTGGITIGIFLLVLLLVLIFFTGFNFG